MLENQFFTERKTRIMLPSGRLVTATPPPSESEDNQAYSMPELNDLRSRSYSPNLLGRLIYYVVPLFTIALIA